MALDAVSVKDRRDILGECGRRGDRGGDQSHGQQGTNHFTLRWFEDNRVARQISGPTCNGTPAGGTNEQAARFGENAAGSVKSPFHKIRI